MKRGARVLVAIALVVSACASVDPSATTTSQGPTPTVPPTTSATPGSPTSQPDEEFCGAEFPLFVAGVEGNDASNIYGTPGPGPGSEPAVAGQMVSYWLGEYGNLEFRWPPAVSLADPSDWTFEVAGKPATIVGVGGTRVTLYVQLDDTGDRCSQFSAEVYGPRADPLGDSIFLFVDALRDGGGAQAYRAEREGEVTLASAGAEYPEGRCQSPLLVDSELTPTDAVTLVANFLADRRERRRAQGCLTESGLASYQNADQTIWPFLCLFDCQDGAAFSATKVPPTESGEGARSISVTAIVTFSDGDSARSLRETYKVNSVGSPSGETVAAITFVYAGPESSVDEAAAMAIVSDFLRQLAEGHYEAAAGLLINEGVSEEVWQRLPGVFETEPAVLFEEFCDRAMCTAVSEVLGSVPSGPNSVDVIVAFDGAIGTVTRRIPVDSFEGNLSVGGLPPDGRVSNRAVPLVESVFRGRPHAGLVVVGEHSVEIWGNGEEDEPTTFYRASNVQDAVAAGEWIAVNTWWGDSYLVPFDPKEGEIYPGPEPIPNFTPGVSALVGGGTVDGDAYALIFDRGELRAVDMSAGTDQPLLETDVDSVVVGASIAMNTLAVTRQLGNTVSFELFAVRVRPDSALEVSGRLDVTADQARGPMVLATDGATAVYIAEGSDQLSSSVVIVDVAGNEIGSYQGPEGWNISGLAFDGRWILATLESPSVTRLSRSDRILVIDTLQDEQWVVNTFARFAFNY